MNCEKKMDAVSIWCTWMWDFLICICIWFFRPLWRYHISNTIRMISIWRKDKKYGFYLHIHHIAELNSLGQNRNPMFPYAYKFQIANVAVGSICTFYHKFVGQTQWMEWIDEGNELMNWIWEWMNGRKKKKTKKWLQKWFIAGISAYHKYLWLYRWKYNMQTEQRTISVADFVLLYFILFYRCTAGVAPERQNRKKNIITFCDCILCLRQDDILWEWPVDSTVHILEFWTNSIPFELADFLCVCSHFALFFYFLFTMFLSLFLSFFFSLQMRL